MATGLLHAATVATLGIAGGAATAAVAVGIDPSLAADLSDGLQWSELDIAAITAGGAAVTGTIGNHAGRSWEAYLDTRSSSPQGLRGS